MSTGPGRAGYVIAAVVLTLGVVACVTILVLGFSGLSMERVVVPGAGTVTLEEAGRYTIYHETRSTVGGRVYVVEDVAGLSVELTETATGEAVPLDAPGANATYELGGRSGRAVLGFEVERPGEYRLAADYGGGEGGPETVLAVGRGLGTRIAMTVVGAIAAVSAGFALALALAAVTFFRRRKAGRVPAGS